MVLSLEAGETQFWRQPNTTPPAQFSQALGLLKVAQTVSVGFYSVLAVVCALGVLEWRWQPHRGRNDTSARMAWWVLVHVACGLLTQVSNAIMTRTTFASEASVLQCHWHHKLAAGGYIAAMGAQYMVLLARAELTLDQSNRWSRLIFKLTKLMTITGMPAIAVLGMVTFNGAVFYAKTCTQELVLWLVWAFMVCSFGLSACFLLMFIMPVYRSVRVRPMASTETRDAARRLLATARRNLRLSIVQIASTAAAQLVGGVLQTAFRDDQGHPENSYLRLVVLPPRCCS